MQTPQLKKSTEKLSTHYQGWSAFITKAMKWECKSKVVLRLKDLTQNNTRTVSVQQTAGNLLTREQEIDTKAFCNTNTK